MGFGTVEKVALCVNAVNRGANDNLPPARASLSEFQFQWGIAGGWVADQSRLLILLILEHVLLEGESSNS